MNKLRILASIGVLVFSVIISSATPKTVTAANGNAFNPNRIIDDLVFNNTNAMSIGDIQNFLNSKVPSCDRWHAAGSGSQGAQPPWTCLRDFSEGGKSAAQIIWEAGQFYNINPQVILATLDKETGLVTDTWPYPWQYRTAMGMGCPDGAPCDAQYYGFTNQVYQGTRHFRNFQLQNPNWTIPHRIGLNNIKWHPNAACGTSQVNIENGATSALYSYTPYRPNQAALNNLYGTGDGCSSYGNRNFWRNFTDWFGSTTATNYDYSFVSSSAAFTNLNPGQTQVNTITIRNMGAKTWYADGSVPVGQHPTRLVLAGYQGSPFADTSDPNWLGTNAQIKMTTPVVNPGENAVFTFNFKGPYQYIYGYPHRFIPVIDGVGGMPDRGLLFVNSTSMPTYSFVSAVFPPTVISNNQKVGVSVTVRNTSTTPWYGDGSVPVGKRAMRLVSMGYTPVAFADPADPNWLGTNAQIKMTQPIVNPGQDATFTFNLIGPFAYRNDFFHFVPVLDGVGGLQDTNMSFRLISPQPVYDYSFVSAVFPPPTMLKGTSTQVSIVLKNTSNFTWRNEANTVSGRKPVRLVMINPLYRSSLFYDSSDVRWLSPAQISMVTPIVNPGENATFTFNWKAPITPGSYMERFAPIVDGAGLMPDKGLSFTVTSQ